MSRNEWPTALSILLSEHYRNKGTVIDEKCLEIILPEVDEVVTSERWISEFLRSDDSGKPYQMSRNKQGRLDLIYAALASFYIPQLFRKAS